VASSAASSRSDTASWTLVLDQSAAHVLHERVHVDRDCQAHGADPLAAEVGANPLGVKVIALGSDRRDRERLSRGLSVADAQEGGEAR
jgi:hypothetical protein